MMAFTFFIISIFENHSYVTSSTYDEFHKYLLRFFVIIFEFTTSVLFTTHFFLILIYKKTVRKETLLKNSSNLSWCFLIIHFSAGPLATMFDLYQFFLYSYFKHGHSLNK